MSFKAINGVILGCIFSTLLSCSSDSILKINSDPVGAEVHVRPLGGSALKKLGVTPLTLDLAETQDETLKGGPLYFELKKIGYETSTVLITDVNLADVDLTVNMSVQKRAEYVSLFDKVSEQLFEAQRLIRTKNYAKALEIIKLAKKEYPELSTVHEMEGSVFYLEKKYKEALDSFSVAYRQNPENFLAFRMKKLLENKLGVKASDKKK